LCTTKTGISKNKSTELKIVLHLTTIGHDKDVSKNCFIVDIVKYRGNCIRGEGGLWCLMPLSTILQLKLPTKLTNHIFIQYFLTNL
jgi:hypothetical protein